MACSLIEHKLRVVNGSLPETRVTVARHGEKIGRGPPPRGVQADPRVIAAYSGTAPCCGMERDRHVYLTARSTALKGAVGFRGLRQGLRSWRCSANTGAGKDQRPSKTHRGIDLPRRGHITLGRRNVARAAFAAHGGRSWAARAGCPLPEGRRNLNRLNRGAKNLTMVCYAAGPTAASVRPLGRRVFTLFPRLGRGGASGPGGPGTLSGRLKQQMLAIGRLRLSMARPAACSARETPPKHGPGAGARRKPDLCHAQRTSKPAAGMTISCWSEGQVKRGHGARDRPAAGLRAGDGHGSVADRPEGPSWEREWTTFRPSLLWGE